MTPDKQLETKLKSFNVSESHIDMLKKSKLERNIYQHFYDYTIAKHELIPTKNIVSLGLRGSPNETWWDHATYRVGYIKESRIDRFEMNNHLKVLSLSQIEDIFTSEDFSNHDDPVTVLFYEDEGRYFVSNGNHRVLWAKLLNLPFIHAKVLYHEINHQSYNNYLSYITLKHKLDDMVKRNNMVLSHQNGNLEITYNNLFIKTYPNPKIKAFNDTRSIELFCEEIADCIEFLEFLEEKHAYYMALPVFIRMKLFSVKSIFISDIQMQLRFKILKKMVLSDS